MAPKNLSKLCFAAALSATCSFAITPPIGVASALGTFTLNDAKIEGNANVFDGSQITTSTASSQVYLRSGAMLTLGINSAATFYKDHLVLRQGATRVEGMNHYGIQAASYRVQSAEPLSEAVVRVVGGQLQVASLTGVVNVFNRQGALLSRVAAGTASAFGTSANNTTANGTPNPQSGATAGQPPAGQSGATATTPEEAAAARKRAQEKLFLALGVTMAGLGLAVDAILQPGSPTPTSP